MSIRGKCLICQTEYELFMSFGRMPIANGFLSPEQFATEYFFELKVGFCQNCTVVQLAELVDREKMFHENYPFFSSTSVRMAQHFEEFAKHVQSDYLQSTDPFVVEIGSNDGIMLRHFAREEISHLGIEPCSNVAQVAIDRGVRTVCKFFDEELAKEIVKDYGKADAFLGANVMCHIPYLHSVVAGIKILLKPDGIVMLEDPYLGDVIKKTSYDQIYDEHVFLFLVSSVSYLFEQHGMEVVDIEPQHTHGGSMRYVIAHKGVRTVSKNVFAQLEKEKVMGLHNPQTYDIFRKNCEHSRDELMALLVNFRNQGERVAGYAATSKSTTVINYCGITTDMIEFISDTTPIKQGKFSPGMHIPVRPYDEFLADNPDYALLFAWNHAEEIVQKEHKFKQSGGKWIVYVPKVEVLK